MEIEPPSLNIPLHRIERWGVLLLAVCAGVTTIAAFFSPAFATAFAASSVVGLPMIMLLFFPSAISSRFSAWGNFGRIAFSLALFGYITLAKKVLVPIAIGIIERVLG